MNLTLSKRGDYVVRAALSLARAYPTGAYRKIREVVAEMDVPATFASQILADLVHAGLATSKAGKSGGYRLVRPPEEINVLDVVEAGEGPLRAERCALGEGPCRWDAVCPLHETWGTATAALRDALAATPLADLVARDRALEAGQYAPPADSHRHARPSVEVADHVLVELPADELAHRLRRAEGTMAARVADAYVEADEIRRRLDPAGLPWAVPGTVAVSLGDPEATDPAADGAASDAGDGAHSVSLCWELPQPAGTTLPSRFEGRLVIGSVDPDRCSLALEGSIRPPLGPLATDDGADRSLQERLAHVTVRSLLRQLARDAEDAVVRSRPGPAPSTARR